MADTANPTPPNPAPVPATSSRWLRIALAVSLAINLGIAGMIGGALLTGHGRPDAMLRDPGFGPFTEALEPDDRAALRRAFFARMPDFRAARRDRRADFAELLEVLRAEPFDAARLATAMERQNQRTAETLALGQQLMADHIAAMTPEARRGFADRLERGLRRIKPPKP
ncbi:periplasmic heavy metal sensor [Rhodobacter ferrooxidans]|uniref:Periplasmic heavy metal sensor n=1 Tax=Rhodobacter ferrooxidans TaxID=371731 RepID=C8S054_9RHOB|nr:periplasmic heavy metal sensor [Rhodobacter sp. SW2]EEW25663.1 conserved hypothetical protein [Rhodobacter sp. SW2]